ncbi:MAG TPA: hypothetical protein VK053_16150 [Jiangellaceae bacterium]|nr:hypothetical protein [Jiangellaceae bacterium]
MASSSRSARIAKWGSIPAGLVISALLVWQASYAAFSDTTTNPGNNWQAGHVELSDDDQGSAMFSATNLAPGDSGENYISGAYTGTLPAELKFYGEQAGSTNELAEHIDLRIVAGTGGGFGSGDGFTPISGMPAVYDGTLANFASTYTDYASGIELAEVGDGGQWSGTFQFTYTLSPDAPNSVQGGTAEIDFTWEAQSISN